MIKKILYITTSLPSITLTFVYREVQVLRDAGYDIITVSMNRPNIAQISAEAIPIYQDTFYLDQVSLLKKILSQVKILLLKPFTMIRLLWVAISEKEIKSLRDILRVIYHFLEAGYLFTLLKDDSIDHIHSHFLTGPTTIAFFLSKYLDVPFSFTMHASLIFIDPIMLRTKLINCKKAVTISRYNKHYLLVKYGHALEEKIIVIHCAIDLQSFRLQQKGKYHPPIILSIGQITERKGFRYLLEACAILKNKGVNFRCCIVGDVIISDGEQQVLEQKMKSLELSEVVSFLGRQPQEKIKDYLQDASIFTLPSIITDSGMREGIPVVLMEAMAMKLPVVSTKTVGIPELIENGKEGLLVEEKNQVDLANALEYLLNNEDKRKLMGYQGRKKVEHEFNLSNVPDHFMTIFN